MLLRRTDLQSKWCHTVLSNEILIKDRPAALSGKGMHLGKKSRTNNIFEQVRGDLPEEPDVSTPLASSAAPQPVSKSSARNSLSGDREGVHVIVSESISARLSREGSMESFEVGGNLQLQITDASLTQIKLNLTADDTRSAQWFTHPKVDKPVFLKNKKIQLKDTSRGFPKNTKLEVLRWRHNAKGGESDTLPLTLTAWVNQGSDDSFSVTVEYELTGDDSLKDVSVTIPFATSEPAVSSYDAVYEVSGDSLDWNIGAIDSDNPNGSFEFEAQADSDSAFFPMAIRFAKNRPFVDVDVGFRIASRFSNLSRLTDTIGLNCNPREYGPGHSFFEGCKVNVGQILCGLVASIDDCK